jgi:hypothetical protein
MSACRLLAVVIQNTLVDLVRLRLMQCDLLGSTVHCNSRMLFLVLQVKPAPPSPLLCAQFFFGSFLVSGDCTKYFLDKRKIGTYMIKESTHGTDPSP